MSNNFPIRLATSEDAEVFARLLSPLGSYPKTHQVDPKPRRTAPSSVKTSSALRQLTS